jgi:NAD(P)-dependent dehydrogenase (short-subunit alcohol dehydrogenase family)
MRAADGSPGAVFVTGASSGIGAGIAAELGALGYTVGCFSRRGFTPPGEGFVTLRGDVRDEAALADGLAELAKCGPVRAVVSCAGRYLEATSAELPTAEVRDLFDVNYFSAFALCRLAYPHLVASGGGTIVTIGSFYDRLGVARNVAYASSKAAIASLARCLAVEWARDSIRVLNIAPGYVKTELNDDFFADGEQVARMERRIPVHRLGEATEIGRLTASIISQNIGYLTGETIYIDGGQGVSL